MPFPLALTPSPFSPRPYPPDPPCSRPYLRDFAPVHWQIASEDASYIFDITKLGNTAFTMGLKALLEDGDVVKVLHDCRQDSAALNARHNVVLTNVFDTQVEKTEQQTNEHKGLVQKE